MKILSVIGARPNFVKIASVSRAINQHNAKKTFPFIDHRIVHTGQHYSENMSKAFFEELEIPHPDYNLEVGSGSYAYQVGEIMKRVEEVILKEQPDFVMVVGDVNSTLASALVASQMGIRVIHVEAGLRSFDRTMPEEINRVLTDSISDILFITEKSALDNLLREGIEEEKIHFVGNVMIDSLLMYIRKSEESNVLDTLCLKNDGAIKSYAVLTLHRPSNVDRPESLIRILSALNEIGRRTTILFPVHPRTRKNIRKLKCTISENIRMLEPLGYLDFLKLMSHARIVFTDSGGIQEETTVLGVPCLTLRENTERPVTLTEGTNKLAGTNPEQIVTLAHFILQSGIGKKKIPELWDGLAAQRIVGTLAGSSVSLQNRYPPGNQLSFLTSKAGYGTTSA